MNRYKNWLFLLSAVIILLLTACGGTKEVIDYADAESFETALNNGENLEGKIVQFIVEELHPDSAFGYNLWAGEHLNFVSSRNPDAKEGDTVVVKATIIESILGRWFIQYEKVDNARIGDNTISSDSDSPTKDIDNSDLSGTSSFVVESQTPSPKPLEIVDYGWYFSSLSGDTVYVDFCGMIYNPNDKLIAKFPKVLVTVKNGDGSILATEKQTGSTVMPGDTITLCGMFSMPISDLTDDAKIYFDVEWSDLGESTSIYSGARTTDFTISNVTERSSSRENFITGEITNNYSEDIDRVNLSIVLRKDGEIVCIDHTFLDNLKVGKAKAFEFRRYKDWPEHDTIDVSAMVW